MSWKRISLEEAKQHELYDSWCLLRVFIAFSAPCALLGGLSGMGNVIGLKDVIGSSFSYIVASIMLITAIFSLSFLHKLYEERSSVVLRKYIIYIWGIFFFDLFLAVWIVSAIPVNQGFFFGQIFAIGTFYFVNKIILTGVLLVHSKYSKTYRLQYLNEVKE